jgi:hypothetical protein
MVPALLSAPAAPVSQQSRLAVHVYRLPSSSLAPDAARVCDLLGATRVPPPETDSTRQVLESTYEPATRLLEYSQRREKTRWRRLADACVIARQLAKERVTA